jgi:mannosidase alpha-like ER degradation enhancer 1
MVYHFQEYLQSKQVNLKTGVLSYEVREACTAGAGTLVLEFGVLSRLLNDDKYEKAAKKALLEIWSRRSKLNLVGSTMNLDDKKWADQLSGIGASLDSFFEYLFKAHVLLGGDGYLDIYNQAYKGVKDHLVDGSGFVYKNVNMYTGKLITPWIDSLAAFFPGLQVLSGDVEAAIRPHLLYTYLWKKHNGLPERFNFQTKELPIESYPLRPELIESTYMLYQATQNHYYLEVGEMILNDLESKYRVKCGFAGFNSLLSKDHSKRMESFFLSETLKYLYLLFDKGFSY